MRDGWKLVEFHDRPPRLFDLSNDPGETRDVSADHPERVDRLARELAHHQQENSRTRSQGEDFEVPLEVEKALEALGYVEGPSARTPPPDPAPAGE
jgi:arylsulfatase A-like enzyme